MLNVILVQILPHMPPLPTTVIACRYNSLVASTMMPPLMVVDGENRQEGDMATCTFEVI
jgi:hypothetical protein